MTIISRPVDKRESCLVLPDSSKPYRLCTRSKMPASVTSVAAVCLFICLSEVASASADISLDKVYEMRFEIVSDCYMAAGSITTKANSAVKCALGCMKESSIKCLRVQFYPWLRRCDMFATWDPFQATYNSMVAFFTGNFRGPCQVYQKAGICRSDFMFLPNYRCCISLRKGFYNWADARSLCNSLDKAFPAIGNTSDLKDGFTYWLQKNLMNPFYGDCLMNDGPFSSRIWLGGQRNSPSAYNSPFQWKPNPTESYPNGFDNFGPGQPSSTPFLAESCLSVFLYPSTMWDDTICNMPKCVLCQSVAKLD